LGGVLGERKNTVFGGRGGCKSKDWEIGIRIGGDGSPGIGAGNHVSKVETLVSVSPCDSGFRVVALLVFIGYRCIDLGCAVRRERAVALGRIYIALNLISLKEWLAHFGVLNSALSANVIRYTAYDFYPLHLILVPRIQLCL
jgi:hypothetical protein